MKKTIEKRMSNSVNTFGQTTYKSYDEVNYIGTPAELAELIKTEPYVYVSMTKDLKKNTALVNELKALNLLPARMDWESDETYFDSFNVVLYNHGEAEGEQARNISEASPVFRFEEG